jgi:hypothetical protein
MARYVLQDLGEVIDPADGDAVQVNRLDLGSIDLFRLPR